MAVHTTSDSSKATRYATWLRRLYALMLVLLVAGCSGGGCSGCAGGAIRPVRGGFSLTPERRIPHAMQVRLTQQGLRSVQTLGPDLLRGFVGAGLPVPTTTGDFGVGRYVICPSGCIINVELPDMPPPLELGFAAPDQLTARIRVILRGDLPVQTCTLTCDSMCRGSFCPAPSNLTIGLDTRRGSHPFIGLRTAIALVRDTHAERASYLRADFVSPTGSGEAIQETPGEEIENDDVSCSGALCGLFPVFRSTILTQFRAQIGGALRPVQEALSARSMPDPPGCPTGTTADGQFCRYPDNTLVPTLLGTDGEGNLGTLLSSITPGLRANGSFLIAAGDPVHNAEVEPDGLTANVFGALVATEGSRRCAPALPAPPIPSIPEWAALRFNAIPGTMNVADLGIGIAEDYLNHAAWHLWDAGFFCLGVNTRMSQSLSTSLLSALLPTLRNVVFPSRGAAAAIALRPQRPPVITIGSGRDLEREPLMRIVLERLAIDFYAFSEERYVRVLTATTDLTVPMNLMREPTGLRPVIGTVTTANTVAAEAPLLATPVAQLARVVDGVLGTAVPMFASNIPPIALPSIPVPGAGGMPVGTVNIEIADQGIQGVSEGTSRFLALFANLRYMRAGAMPLRAAGDAGTAGDASDAGAASDGGEARDSGEASEGDAASEGEGDAAVE